MTSTRRCRRNIAESIRLTAWYRYRESRTHPRHFMNEKIYYHGATNVSRCKHSSAQVPLNASTSAGSGTVRNEPMPASTPTASGPPMRPGRKHSGSMSLESDVLPKCLKLGPLKEWGAERECKLEQEREQVSCPKSDMAQCGILGTSKLIWRTPRRSRAVIKARKWPTERVRQLNAVMWFLQRHPYWTAQSDGRARHVGSRRRGAAFVLRVVGITTLLRVPVQGRPDIIVVLLGRNEMELIAAPTRRATPFDTDTASVICSTCSGRACRRACTGGRDSGCEACILVQIEDSLREEEPGNLWFLGSLGWWAGSKKATRTQEASDSITDRSFLRTP
ncbi:hypothetical protein C8J57DRAFT_1241288 [Mycena rebaudengoi]|nr:hypothetical protein C8J57DRAFT_1241288 [Mycena rebaudengoi]